MRLLVRTGTKWEPSPCTDLLSWLIAHNGSEAVAIDEEGPEKVFYCGSEENIRQYEAEKKKALPFSSLITSLDPTTHPLYCDRGERAPEGYAFCTGQCGGERKWCKNERG